jgi:hypothetical protein
MQSAKLPDQRKVPHSAQVVERVFVAHSKRAILSDAVIGNDARVIRPMLQLSSWKTRSTSIEAAVVVNNVVRR